MKRIRSRRLANWLLAGLMVPWCGAARAQAIRIVPTPVPKEGGNQISNVPTPTPQPAQNQSIGIDEVCALFGCDDADHPDATEVVGRATPGARLAISGRGFGDAPGRFVLRASSGDVDLVDLDWHGNFVAGTVPDLRGVADKPDATVRIVNRWGRATHELPAAFVALRCGGQVPRAAVTVVSCSNSATHWNCNGHSNGNFYNPDEKGESTISARHRNVTTFGENFTGATFNGTDRYFVSVPDLHRVDVFKPTGYDFLSPNARFGGNDIYVDWTVHGEDDGAYILLAYTRHPCRVGE